MMLDLLPFWFDDMWQIARVAYVCCWHAYSFGVLPYPEEHA